MDSQITGTVLTLGCTVGAVIISATTLAKQNKYHKENYNYSKSVEKINNSL